MELYPFLVEELGTVAHFVLGEREPPLIATSVSATDFEKT